MLTGSYFIFGDGRTAPIFASELYEMQILSVNIQENSTIGGGLSYQIFRANTIPCGLIDTINFDQTLEIEFEMVSESRLDTDWSADVQNPIESIVNGLFGNRNFQPLIVYPEEAKMGLKPSDVTSDLVAKCKSTFGYYNCILTSGEYIRVTGKDGYGIYGIKATVSCDSTFMWKDKSVTFTADELAEGAVVTNESCLDTTYCNLTINIGSTGGTVIVQNTTFGDLTIVENTLPNDTIQILVYPYRILSNLSSNKQLLYDNFNKVFAAIGKGNSTFFTVGDVTSITLEWKEARLRT